MGKPVYYRKWSKRERLAFGRFNTPNKLAEALSHKNKHICEMAKLSMTYISHIRNTFKNHLVSIDNIKKYMHHIAYIGTLETMDTDILFINDMIGFKSDIIKNEMNTHKTPDEYLELKNLSDKAKTNLIKHYEEDYKIIEFLISERMIYSDYSKLLSNYKK